ncbi:MAG TPA: diaminopimelate epimerase [Thiotrichales bacterium]|nr:diaminopimelate epimerase [Thiotrichales bacterium]
MHFVKMHGLGNDFVVIDAIRQHVELPPDAIRHIADRRRGIGCDQVLLVERPQSPDADFRYRIFNADGSEVEQCGNGARCFARFVRDEGLTTKDRIPVETLAGLIELEVLADGQVRVDMGEPVFEPQRIPFQAEARAPSYALEVNGESLDIGAVSMGNPHAVLRVEDVSEAPVARLGPAIEHHPRFPQRANVGFMQILDRGRIRLRVFERGVGETEACGTGACAAVVVGRLQGLLDEEVQVSLPGGDLVISWAGEGAPLYMTGPAERVFEGSIEL